MADRFTTTPFGAVNLSEVLAVSDNTILFKSGYMLMVSLETARAVQVALCPLKGTDEPSENKKKSPLLRAGMTFDWTDGKRYVILAKGEEEYTGCWLCVVMRNADNSPSIFLEEEDIFKNGYMFQGPHHG